MLFVCTANVLDTVPGPLLDRMEVIELSGYMADEKVAIANRYLIPQAQRETSIPPEKVRLVEHVGAWRNGSNEELSTVVAEVAGLAKRKQ